MKSNAKSICASTILALGFAASCRAEPGANTPAGSPATPSALGGGEAEATACTTYTYEVAFAAEGECSLNEHGPASLHRLGYTGCATVEFRRADGQPLKAIPGNPDKEGSPYYCPRSRTPADREANVVKATYDPPSNYYECVHVFELGATSPTCDIEITVNPVDPMLGAGAAG